VNDCRLTANEKSVRYIVVIYDYKFCFALDLHTGVRAYWTSRWTSRYTRTHYSDFEPRRLCSCSL